MLLNLKDLVRKYNLKITGVVHVGGHYGEEDGDYWKLGITRRIYIEASKPTFDILKANTPGAIHYNFAAGAEPKQATLNVETHNKGQSNSLLQPGTHLKHYPLITFDEVEDVEVRPLDSIDTGGCNLLNMDVQGYELEVLKGSVQTLAHIDYVYTEVNTDEVYEGCARVEQLDAFLKDFDRVETSLTQQGWGDALYIRRDTSIPNIREFQPHHPHNYPPDNDLIFEEWYGAQRHYNTRTHLPIYWTSYYCQHNYGKDARAMKRLQEFIDSLPKTPYYTVVQYDDSILSDISGLDIKVFGMGNSKCDYHLPLLCKPHGYKFATRKDVTLSYVGRNTHPIRKQIVNLMHKSGYIISDQAIRLEKYCNILARSKFVLCPRGYGINSFRIAESLEYGAIPIYMSDEFMNLPEFDKYGIRVSSIHEIQKAIEGCTIDTSQLSHYYNKYFTYESIRDYIHETLNNSTVS